VAGLTVDQLAEQLRAAFGSGLRAVVVYGSSVAGERIRRRSDTNVLVLVEQLDREHLAREGAVARAWEEGGNPPPLTLTVQEWSASADIFAMEYADILERHRVVYGTLPVDGISVQRSDLRLQLERETMGKLLALRQGVLSAGSGRRELLELLSASLSTFMVLFRAAVRLHDETAPTDYLLLAQRVGELAGLDATPFARVVRHLRGSERIPPDGVPAVVDGYLAGASRLAAYVNAID
jgi:predicted nucleotidyltransferase